MNNESIKRIAPTMPAHLAGPVAPSIHPNIHGDLHQFIDETREEWKDTIRFSAWLGICKRFTIWELHSVRASVRDSPGVRSKSALFFYKLKEMKKRR